MRHLFASYLISPHIPTYQFQIAIRTNWTIVGSSRLLDNDNFSLHQSSLPALPHHLTGDCRCHTRHYNRSVFLFICSYCGDTVLTLHRFMVIETFFLLSFMRCDEIFVSRRISEYLLLRDTTLIPNILWFEYTNTRQEARARSRKLISMKSQ